MRVDTHKAHTFAAARRLTDGAPGEGTPFALHLTDESGKFRLLALDFDAHHAGSTADTDLAACTAALTAAGIEHLVCSSGPGGGYHVWIRLSTAISPHRLAPLIDAFCAMWPSLDRGPLSNSRTGCVRAPGSPHRAGGTSMPLTDPHIRPVSLRALRAVITQLTQLPQASSKATAGAGIAPVPVHVDAQGHPYLSGPRRPLNPQIRALARAPITDRTDASAVGWSILLTCAHARMQYRDVHEAAFNDRWPGLEFVRTRRTSAAERTPRFDAAAELGRQWAKAVTAASYTNRDTSGPSPARHAAEAAVADLLTRMNAQPARWAGKTGTQDRLVLLALAARTLAAATGAVHFSERDWALAAGLTRDTVADRLKTLVQQGWVARVQRAAGPWAAVWRIAGPGGGEQRSGAVFTPEMQSQLDAELECAREDIWHARTLGVLGMRVWTHLAAGCASVRELATTLGICPATVRSKLRALRSLGLCTADGRVYRGRSRLARAAVAAGVDGAHADRVRLYRLHSAVFVWWFTTRYQPDRSDALGEWGEFPDPAEAEQVHPTDIALAYGATATGPPVSATTWGAAMAAQDRHREADPDSWWELVAAARAALPAPDMLLAPHQWARTAA
ncbi:helix-turn-helix domain-containing protein [Dietzia kunjamensis]|uniref:helix-turn-helix domain-containing protein n=1 Tax=Dietzia kunjamensis TaxID=322509 RepID=UPI002097F05D|nr:helix-turn-helix domain-containing protein [Dietzia kunjamensis]USX48004.1 helix-turn-helix domain-containing protein [Dietzia kunjamensis]